ncbi:MAG TPA: tyrosine-type recombinase/integrase [Terriglobales bacterium]|nr:tyrosine-type recombinase/integrase [Terriglobales bacterium]
MTGRTRYIEAGGDPLTLARLMGHEDLKTTQRYVHLSKGHLAKSQQIVERFRLEQEFAEAEQDALRAGNVSTTPA